MQRTANYRNPRSYNHHRTRPLFRILRARKMPGMPLVSALDPSAPFSPPPVEEAGAFNAFQTLRRGGPQIDPAVKLQAQTQLADYVRTRRVQDPEAPLFPTVAGQAERMRTERLASLLTQPLADVLPAETFAALEARAATAPDPDAYRARQIVKTFIQAQTGQPLPPAKYDFVRASLARQLGTENTDTAVHSALRTRYTEHAQATEKLTAFASDIQAAELTGNAQQAADLQRQTLEALPDHLRPAAMEELFRARREARDLKRRTAGKARSLARFLAREQLRGAEADAIGADAGDNAAADPVAMQEAVAMIRGMMPEERNAVLIQAATLMEGLYSGNSTGKTAAEGLLTSLQSLVSSAAEFAGTTAFQVGQDTGFNTATNRLGLTAADPDFQARSDARAAIRSAGSAAPTYHPGDSWYQKALLATAGQVPNFAAFFAGPTGLGVLGTSMAGQSYQRQRLESPDADPRLQLGTAAVSGVAQLGAEVVMTRAGLQFLRGKSPTIAGILSRAGIRNKYLRAGIGGTMNAVSAAGTEYTEEIVQGAIDNIAADTARELSSIAPETDWRQFLNDWIPGRSAQAEETLYAILPYALIGAGVAGSYQHFKHGDFLQRSRPMLRAIGLPDPVINAIQKADPVEAAQLTRQAFQTELQIRTAEEKSSALESFREAASAWSAAGFPIIDTETNAFTEETRHFFQRDPFDPESRQYFDTEVEALEAWASAMQDIETDALDAIVAASQEDILRLVTGEGAALEGKAETIPLSGTAPRLEDAAKVRDYRGQPLITADQITARLKAFLLQGGSQRNVPDLYVKARRSAERLRNGMTRQIIQYFQDTDPVAILEDSAEGFLDQSIADGFITASEILPQIRRVETATGRDYLAAEYTADDFEAGNTMPLLEAFSAMVRDYAFANLRSEALPDTLREWVGVTAITSGSKFAYAQELARAPRLAAAIRQGRIDASFESLLADAIGIDTVAREARMRQAYEAQLAAEALEGFPEIADAARGKLPHPQTLRDAGDPMAGEVQRIYDHFKKPVRRGGKTYYRTNEANDYFLPVGTKVKIDELRQSLNEQGFSFETPGDLLAAIDDSIGYGIRHHATMSLLDEAETMEPSFSVSPAERMEFKRDQLSQREIIKSFSYKSFIGKVFGPAKGNPYTDDATVAIFDKDRLVGFVGIYLQDSTDEITSNKQEAVSFEPIVEVDVDYQRQGIGSELYRQAEAFTQLPAKPAKNHTAAAEALWNARRRRGETSFALGRATVTPGAETRSFPTQDGGLIGPASFAISAYHGTPHKVDKFSLDKIGTGEGAQAYGWGLYFAETQDVATQYANMMAMPNMVVRADGETLVGLEKSLADTYFSEGKPAAEMAARMNGREWQAAWNRIKDKRLTRGNLYTVTLKVEDDQLLDWDKTLDEQPEIVARMRASDWWEFAEMRLEDGIDNPTGQSLFRYLSEDTDPQDVSDILKAAGIRGIRYLDGNSRSDGEGTYNYVIFDDADIEITEENGQPVNAQAGASFALSPASINRIEGAIAEKMAAGPQERADYYTRLRDRLAGVLIRYKEHALASDANAVDAQLRAAGEAIAETRAIIDALPMEARGRVRLLITDILDAKTQRDRVEAMFRLIDEADKALEITIQESYLQRDSQPVNASTGASFALSPASINRIEGAIAAKMAAGPQERADYLNRFRDRLAGVLIRYKEHALASDANAVDAQLRAAREAIEETRTIIDALPMEARGRVRLPITEILDAKSQRGRVTAMLRLIDEADAALEVTLRESYLESISRLLDLAKPDLNPATRQARGRLTPAIQAEVDQIIGLIQLTPIQAGLAQHNADVSLQRAENTLNGTDGNAYPTDLQAAQDAYIEARIHKARVDIFAGVLAGNSADLAQANDQLLALYKQGRYQRTILDDSRRQELWAMRDEVRSKLKDVTQATHRKAVEKDGFREFAKSFRFGHYSFHQAMETLFPGSSTAAEFMRRARKADAAYREATIGARKAWEQWARTTFDLPQRNWRFKLQSIIATLSTPRDFNIELREGVRFETESMEEDQAIAILEGRLKVGWETDKIAMDSLRQALMEFRMLRDRDKKRVQKVKFQRLVARGTASYYRASDLEAAYILQLAAQKEYGPTLDAYGFTEKVIQQIDAAIDERALWISDYLSQQYDAEYDRLNPVFQRLFGFSMPKIKNYAPGRFAHQGEAAVLDPEAGDAAPVNALSSGFTKSRVNHMARPKGKNALGLYWEHISSTEYFIHWAELIRDMRAVYLDPKVRFAIEGNFGTKTAGDFYRWLDVLAADGNVRALATAADAEMSARMQASLAATGLAFNFGSILKQIPAALNGFLEMPFREFMAGAREVVRNPKLFARVWNSPTIQQRIEQGISPEDMRLLQAANAKPSAILEAFRLGRLPLAYGDAVATSFYASAAYAGSYARAKRANLTDAQADEIAMAHMDRIVKRTAQPATTQDRSLAELTASRQGMLLGYMFRSDPRQKAAIILQSFQDFAAGRIDKPTLARRVLFGWIIYGVANEFLSDVWAGMSRDDDPERWDIRDYLASAVAGPLSGLGIVGGVMEATIRGSIGTDFFAGKTYTASAGDLFLRSGGSRVVSTLMEESGYDDLGQFLKDILADSRDYATLLSPITEKAAVFAVGARIARDTYGVIDNFTESDAERQDRILADFRATQKTQREETRRARDAATPPPVLTPQERALRGLSAENRAAAIRLIIAPYSPAEREAYLARLIDLGILTPATQALLDSPAPASD